MKGRRHRQLTVSLPYSLFSVYLFVSSVCLFRPPPWRSTLPSSSPTPFSSHPLPWRPSSHQYRWFRANQVCCVSTSVHILFSEPDGMSQGARNCVAYAGTVYEFMIPVFAEICKCREARSKAIWTRVALNTPSNNYRAYADL